MRKKLNLKEMTDKVLGLMKSSDWIDISDLVVELNGDVAGTFGDDEIASPHAVVIGSFLSGVADTPVFS